MIRTLLTYSGITSFFTLSSGETASVRAGCAQDAEQIVLISEKTRRRSALECTISPETPERFSFLTTRRGSRTIKWHSISTWGNIAIIWLAASTGRNILSTNTPSMISRWSPETPALIALEISSPSDNWLHPSILANTFFITRQKTKESTRRVESDRGLKGKRVGDSRTVIEKKKGVEQRRNRK